MGIKFKDYNPDTEKLTYCLVPEELSKKEVDVFNRHKVDELHNKGWTKEKTLKEIGRIPWAVLYNYAHSQGIPSERISEFYAENKGVNVKKLLNDFTVFRIGDNVV